MIPNVPYLREIPDHEWVREVISEKFQNATELMTKNAIVYGGAIRDALAGLPLLGDLDIAVPMGELKAICDNFQSDTRWRRRDQEKSPFHRVKSAGYAGERLEALPMQDIIEFYTFNDAIVQIVVSNMPGPDSFERAIEMARQVDIRCCGMALTHDGQIIESLDGAFEDCKNRVLVINELSTTIHLETVPSSIEKLVGRGWTNNIDIKQVVADVEAKRKKAEREKLRRHAAVARKHKNPFLGDAYDLPRIKPRLSSREDDLTQQFKKDCALKAVSSTITELVIPGHCREQMSLSELSTIVAVFNEDRDARYRVYMKLDSPNVKFICRHYTSMDSFRHELIDAMVRSHMAAKRPEKRVEAKPKTEWKR